MEALSELEEGGIAVVNNLEAPGEGGLTHISSGDQVPFLYLPPSI